MGILQSTFQETRKQREERLLDSNIFRFYEEAKTPEELEKIKGRYFTRHTTYGVVWGEDYADEEILARIVDDAASFNGDADDISFFKRLFRLLPDSVRNDKDKYDSLYLRLGYYSYLADMSSMYPLQVPDGQEPPTILKSGRLRAQQFPHESDYDWLVGTLRNAGLYDRFYEVRQSVEDWRNYGNFTVNGKLQEHRIEHAHDGEKIDVYTGYVRHAMFLCDPNKVFAQIRRVIERALGIRDELRNAENNYDMPKLLERIESLNESTARWFSNNKAKDWLSDKDYPLRKLILNGEKIKKSAFRAEIEKGRVEGRTLSEKGRNFFREFFKFMPDEYFDVIENTSYRIIYYDDGNVMVLLPKEMINGEDVAYFATGFNDSRNRISLISRGEKELNIEFIAHAELHESCHKLFNDDHVTTNTEVFGIRNPDGTFAVAGKVGKLYQRAETLFERVTAKSIDEIMQKLQANQNVWNEFTAQNRTRVSFERLFKMISDGDIMSMYDQNPQNPDRLLDRTRQDLEASLSPAALEDLKARYQTYKHGTPYVPGAPELLKEQYIKLREARIDQFYRNFSSETAAYISAAISETGLGVMYETKSGALENETYSDILNINSKYNMGYRLHYRADEIVANVYAEVSSKHAAGGITRLLPLVGERVPESLKMVHDFSFDVVNTYRETSQYLKNEVVKDKATANAIMFGAVSR